MSINNIILNSGHRAFALGLIPAWAGTTRERGCCGKCTIPIITLIIGAIPLLNLYVLQRLIRQGYYDRKWEKIVVGENASAAALYRAAFYSNLMYIITTATVAIGTTLFVVAACHQGVMADYLNYVGGASLAVGVLSIIADTYYYKWSPRPELQSAVEQLRYIPSM